MTRLGFLLAAASVAVAGCDQPALSRAQAIAAHDFKDPSSVQFRDLNKVRGAEGPNAVCGEVNAKNAFGASSGFRRFIVNLDRGTMQVDPDKTPVALDYGASAYEGVHFDLEWTINCKVTQVN